MLTYTGRIDIVLIVNCFMNVDIYTEYMKTTFLKSNEFFRLSAASCPRDKATKI